MTFEILESVFPIAYFNSCLYVLLSRGPVVIYVHDVIFCCVCFCVTPFLLKRKKCHFKLTINFKHASNADNTLVYIIIIVNYNDDDTFEIMFAFFISNTASWIFIEILLLIH